MYQQQMENLRAQAKEKQEGGLKETDVGAMADDFANVPDVKNYQNAQSMWVTWQEARHPRHGAGRPQHGGRAGQAVRPDLGGPHRGRPERSN